MSYTPSETIGAQNGIMGGVSWSYANRIAHRGQSNLCDNEYCVGFSVEPRHNNNDYQSISSTFKSRTLIFMRIQSGCLDATFPTFIKQSDL